MPNFNVRVEFQPGCLRQVTEQTAGLRWTDMNMMRFRWGKPQTIGGWTSYHGIRRRSNGQGKIRRVVEWAGLAGQQNICVFHEARNGAAEAHFYLDGDDSARVVLLDGWGSKILAGEGWGEGDWGSFGWGGIPAGYSGHHPVRHPDLLPYGEDLILSWPGQTPRLFDRSSRAGNPAETAPHVIELAGAPTEVGIMGVFDAGRHLVSFGSQPEGGGLYDPMLVRWSSAGDITDWNATDQNSAGSVRLDVGSRITAAHPWRDRWLIWTDKALYQMVPTRSNRIFDFLVVNDAGGALSSRGVAQGEDAVFWLGDGNFWVFDGRARELGCSVQDYFFSDSEDGVEQGSEGWAIAGPNRRYSEIWWFYVSRRKKAGSTVPDRYVLYNYKENSWAIGELTRTEWADSLFRPGPLASDGKNVLEHEVGNSRPVGESDVEGIPFIQSGRFTLDGLIDRDRPGFNVFAVNSMTVDMDRHGTGGDIQVSGRFFVQSFHEGSDPDPDDLNRTLLSPDASLIPFYGYGRYIDFEFRSVGGGQKWELGEVYLEITPVGNQ